MDDWQTVSEYVRTGAENAFRSLVDRHLGLVHSIAMRQVRDPELAREVSQAVFVLLARKARSFRPSIVLSAWLFRTTRFVALRAVRSEHRRQRREQEAMRMQILNEPAEAWPRLAPVLDETLGDLNESDRGALLLRFYEERNLHDVGAKLGISEEAAKKRVSRALDKLRAAFARRGFTVPTLIITGILSGKMAEAAPTSLAGAIASSAVSGASSAVPVLVEEVLAAWKWARVKMALGVGVAIIAGLFVIRGVAPESAVKPVSTIADKNVQYSGSVTATTERATTPVGRSFLFKVVDAETGSGVPGAELHARYWVKEIEENNSLITDGEGVCAVPLLDQPMGRLDLGILAPGYVQKFFTWWPGHFGPLPKSYTFKLERGVGIGGFVRDAKGKPVANTRIILKFPGTGESDSRERERERLGFWDDLPVAKTDAAGRWQSANVPPRYEDFSISVKHADFPDAWFAVRSDNDSKGEGIAITELYQATAVLTLQPGLAISGVVTDENDRPIAGAKVCTKRWADPKEPAAITGPDGKFTLRNLKGAGFPLTVMADGFAPERTNADTADGQELKIRLKPGSVLRVRVVDPSGQPVARADVALEHWREHGTLELREPTDENGIFEWRSAPSDSMKVCVLKGGYATSRGIKVEANGEEQVITIKPQFRLIGRVVDAESGQPVGTFKAIPGYGKGGSRWDIGETAYGREGQYELSFSEDRPPYSVRIVAAGYEPAESAGMPHEQVPQVCDFELRRGIAEQPIKGVVLSPEGQPVANASIALCTIEKGACIGRGRIAPNSYARSIKTDEEGRFELERDPGGHTVVAVGREGVARVSLTGEKGPLQMRLQPWGKIEGFVRLATGVGQRIQLLDQSFSRYGGGTSLDFSFSATSDSEGRFVIEQAPPGEYELFIAPMDGTPYSHRTLVTVKAGQTAHAQIGGDGLRVRGRFELAGSEDAINWSNQVGYITFRSYERAPQPPANLERASVERWKREFWESERGRAFLRAEKSITLEIAADGSFTGESVKPGDYELTVNLYDRVGDRRQGEHLRDATLLGCVNSKKISIPESSEPLDLGTITLQPTGRQAKR
jgi:RNA polymerase sigma factor (sigma-70 family)